METKTSQLEKTNPLFLAPENEFEEPEAFRAQEHLETHFEPGHIFSYCLSAKS